MILYSDLIEGEFHSCFGAAALELTLDNTDISVVNIAIAYDAEQIMFSKMYKQN